MNKTHGKIDELAAVDAVSQQRAVGLGRVGRHDDDWLRWYQLGIEHGLKGGALAGKIVILKTIGELAAEMEREYPAQADTLRIVARQLYAALKPTGPRT
jgi:hypothetical protein